MNTIELIKPSRLAGIGVGRARVPGTCGELMQGTLEGVDFLINSPIQYFADVKVTVSEGPEIRIVTPGNFRKVKKAVRSFLDMNGYQRRGAFIEVANCLPRGKGFASSTAEIAAAISATSIALTRYPWKDSYVKIVLDTDRSTDAVYAPGIVNCSFLTGKVIESFSCPSNLAFIIVDSGGQVETMSFDRQRARKISYKFRSRLRNAYNLMRLGLRKQNVDFIAQASTESAMINQHVLPKDLLNQLVSGTREQGGLGVNCAHTGTVLGVMFDANVTDTATLLHRVGQLAGEERILGVFKLTSGGVRRVAGDLNLKEQETCSYSEAMERY